MAPSRPLEGLMVLGIKHAVAALIYTSRLADAGATEIKTERPESDFAPSDNEAANSQNNRFIWLKRGELSIVLVLTMEVHKQQSGGLLVVADVLIQDGMEGALERLGSDVPKFRSSLPFLIKCSISGCGFEGQVENRKADDLHIRTESGLAYLTGGPKGQSRLGISLFDIATGATAFTATLAARLTRQNDGRESDIHVSIFDVMADWLKVPLLHHELSPSSRRIRLARPSVLSMGSFPPSMDGFSDLDPERSRMERALQERCRGRVFVPSRAICAESRAGSQLQVGGRGRGAGILEKRKLGRNHGDSTSSLERLDRWHGNA